MFIKSREKNPACTHHQSQHTTPSSSNPERSLEAPLMAHLIILLLDFLVVLGQDGTIEMSAGVLSLRHQLLHLLLNQSARRKSWFLVTIAK